MHSRAGLLRNIQPGETQANPLGGGMRRLSLALAGLSVCVLCAGGMNVTAATNSKEQALTWLGARITTYQHTAWHWQHVMGVPATPTSGVGLSELGIRDAKAALARWQRRAT